MATFVKTKFGWQAQVALRVNGKAVRKAKTHPTKRAAQIWASEFELTASAGTDGNDTVSQVFDRYAKEYSANKKGGEGELVRLKKFARQPLRGKPFGDYIISDLTTADMAEWRHSSLNRISAQTGRTLKTSSVRREMGLLKNIFVVAHEEWELIRHNPMAKIKRPPESRRRKRRVYQEEIDKLTEALELDKDPWITEKQITGAMFLFAIETAMRCGEIRDIVNKYVDGKVVHLIETKNGDSRDVPLTVTALEILEKVRGNRTEPGDHPFNIDAVSRDSVFRAAVKRSNIENLHFHDTRHEAITRLAKRFTNMLDLARVTGHKNLNELLTYYEASGAELAERLNSSTSKDDTA